MQRSKPPPPTAANQSRIDQFYRVSRIDLPGVSILPALPRVNSRTAAGPSQRENTTVKVINASGLPENPTQLRRASTPCRESGKKRSLDDENKLAATSKRRLTVDEGTLGAVGKENRVSHYRSPSMRNLLKVIPGGPRAVPKQRQPLNESTNRKISAEEVHRNGAYVKARAKSFTQATVERVLQLERLTLRDEGHGKSLHFTRFKKHANSLPVEVEASALTPEATSSAGLHICKSTRFLATLFHHQIEAFPEFPNDSESSDGEGHSTNVPPQPYTIWLPSSPIDENHVDEYHLNHDRVYRYLFARDLEFTAQYTPTFLSQNGVTEGLRATLCDWMIKVQQYLDLRTETLHLAVSILDRYTWLTTGMDPKKYQLVGITSLFVAAKFVERFPPATRTLCYLTENSYKSEEILEFELHLLEKLDFQIAIPLPHQFLTRSLLGCSDLTAAERSRVELICVYLFELSLIKVAAVRFTSSVRCAAAVRLARHLIGMERQQNYVNTQKSIKCSSPIQPNPIEVWPERLAQTVGHEDKGELKEMCMIYVQLLKRYRMGVVVSNQRYQAAYHKYSNRLYRNIARSSLLRGCAFSEIEHSLCSSSNSTLTSLTTEEVRPL